MATTLKDIADYVGTSVTTVSKILGDKPIRVSEKTRAQVQQAAELLNYIPNAAGVNLKKGRTDTIAVIVGDLLYPYYAKLLKEISHQLRSQGKSVVVCDIDNNFETEKEHYLRLRTGYVDGAIVIPSPTTMTAQNLQNANGILSSLHLPLVIIAGGGDYLYPGFSTVGTDPFQSARQATEYLLSLGHRKIAYVSEMPEDSPANRKLAGYRDALAQHGLSDGELVFRGYARYAGGRTAYRVAMDAGASAVLCSNDHLAVGCCSAAINEGRKIPAELSIVGMDNTMITKQYTPQITTVDQDVAAIAGIALRLLSSAEERPQHIDLEPELILRASCLPPAMCENDEKSEG